MTLNTKKVAPSSPNPLIFISYCHRDEAFRERLMVHLAPLKREGIETWVDNDLIAGDELDPSIRRALRKADIFVALASPDYLHSTYCYEKEYEFALRKAKRKGIHVVVAIARQCQWKRTRIGRYLVLPKDGKAIEDFGRRSQAFEQIVEGIRAVLKRIKSERDAAVTSHSVKTKPTTTAKPSSAQSAAKARTTSATAKRKSSKQIAKPKPAKTAGGRSPRRPVRKRKTVSTTRT